MPDPTPKRPYSYSQLHTYTECPRRYYYVYELGLRLPPPFLLVEGRAYHQTLEQANRELLENRAVSAKEMVERYEERLHSLLSEDSTEEGVEASRDQVVESVNGANLVLPVYAENIYVHLRPVLIEHRFDGALDDSMPFCGVVDLVENDSIVDYKIVSKIDAPNVVRRSPQLKLYQHFIQRPRVSIVQLSRNSNRVMRADHVPTDIERSNAVAWARRVIQAIEASRATGQWSPASPTSWTCDKKWCGFYGICYTKEE